MTHYGDFLQDTFASAVIHARPLSKLQGLGQGRGQNLG